MNKPIKLPLGENSVRFTSDGWVFIEDAIKALAGGLVDGSESVWKRVKKDHPDILNHCSSYITKEGKKIQTINIEGMDMIYMLLLEYL